MKEERKGKEREGERAKLQKGDLLCHAIPDTSEDNRLIFREKKDKSWKKWVIRVRNSRYFFRGIISQELRRKSINRVVEILVSHPRASHRRVLTTYHGRLRDVINIAAFRLL